MYHLYASSSSVFTINLHHPQEHSIAISYNLLLDLGIFLSPQKPPVIMLSSLYKVLPILAAIRGVTARPAPQGGPALQALPNIYSLTAYAPGNKVYDGLKVENLVLFQSHVSQYCPTIVQDSASGCPNGTDMAFVSNLTPVSKTHPCYTSSLDSATNITFKSVEVPGGQNLYVNQDGSLGITTQHEEDDYPAGSYKSYQGWTWTALEFSEPAASQCPTEYTAVNCDPPSGYWSFSLPGSPSAGVKACPVNSVVALYAPTPDFNRTDCVDLVGLGTHNYTGPNPPVWAY